MPRRGSATKRKDEDEDTSPTTATKKARKPRLDRALFAKQDKSEDKAQDKSEDKAQDKAQEKVEDNPETSDEDEDESDDDVVDLTARVKTEASTTEPATRETKAKAAVDPMEVYSFVHETSSPHPVVASISQHVEYLISVHLRDVEKRVQAVETTSVATKQWVSNLEQTMKRNFREIPLSPALKTTDTVSGTPVMSKTPQAATVATPVAATVKAATPVAATVKAVTPVAATANAVTPVAATANVAASVPAAIIVPKPAPIAVSASTPPKVECTPQKHQSPKFDASTGAIYCAMCGDILKMPTK
jgi:hypothetical protein